MSVDVYSHSIRSPGSSGKRNASGSLASTSTGVILPSSSRSNRSVRGFFTTLFNRLPHATLRLAPLTTISISSATVQASGNTAQCGDCPPQTASGSVLNRAAREVQLAAGTCPQQHGSPHPGLLAKHDLEEVPIVAVMRLRRTNQLLNRRLIRRALLQVRLHRDPPQASGADFINRLFGANVIGDAVLGRALPIVGVFDMQLGVRMQQPALTIAGVAISAEHLWKRSFLGIR